MRKIWNSNTKLGYIWNCAILEIPKKNRISWKAKKNKTQINNMQFRRYFKQNLGKGYIKSVLIFVSSSEALSRKFQENNINSQ